MLEKDHQLAVWNPDGILHSVTKSDNLIPSFATDARYQLIRRSWAECCYK